MLLAQTYFDQYAHNRTFLCKSSVLANMQCLFLLAASDLKTNFGFDILKNYMDNINFELHFIWDFDAFLV